MKRILMVMGAVLLMSCQKSGSVNMESDTDKFSYVLGQQIGSQMKAQGLEINADVFAQSLKDALTGKESTMTPDEMQQVMISMNEKLMQKAAAGAEENKSAGQKFLDENKTKEGVKTTASGLQYQIINAGKGKSPSKESTVKVHYKGTLIDGTQFDSSYERNEPAEFPVGGVIAGWTEALQLMKEGAKWKLFIPSDLAYGPRGRPSIPPNSVLIFEVELLEVKS